MEKRMTKSRRPDYQKNYLREQRNLALRMMKDRFRNILDEEKIFKGRLESLNTEKNAIVKQLLEFKAPTIMSEKPLKNGKDEIKA